MNISLCHPNLNFVGLLKHIMCRNERKLLCHQRAHGIINCSQHGQHVCPWCLCITFDDVTCIYYHKILHVYNMNCKLLPITKIILPNITTFTQLNLFLKSAKYQGHAMHRGWTISSCIGGFIMPCEHLLPHKHLPFYEKKIYLTLQISCISAYVAQI